MPNTRASTRRLASKRSRREHTGGYSPRDLVITRTVTIPYCSATSDDDLNNSVSLPRDDVEAETGMSVMDHLNGLRSGVEELYTRIRSLGQENGSLKSELQRVQQTVRNGAGRSLAARERASPRQIRPLERKIADLNAAREKDRRTIEKLRDKEVERDAKELADDHDGAVPIQQTADLGESAIKLLRHMCETIDMNTLAEEEECAVCMEEMKVGNCYSLQCRHPVCVECFKQLKGDGSNEVFNDQTESVQCPHCREICPREECEIITHTAVQQWDLLLDISRQWAAMDTCEMDIGEEDEDNFIDDGSVAAAESPRSPGTLGEAVDPDPVTSTASTSPNDTGSAAYKGLPSPLKRQRLEELAAKRAVKQRV